MKTNYPFLGNQKITATLVYNDIIWIAFYGISGICKLYGCSVYDLDTIYWDLDIIADEITAINVDAYGYLYLAIDNATNIGIDIDSSSPNIGWALAKDAGVLEKAVDVVYDSVLNYNFFLSPGLLSGENAKISVYDDSNDNYVETIDLTTIFNASKISADDSGNLWVQSDLNSVPILTKVYPVSGVWDFINYTLS